MRVFKLIVPASLNYSESVRMVSMEIWEDAGFSKREKNMIRLVIDELFMNAVKYWSDKDSSIMIEWWFEWETVFFSIEDEWKWKQKVSAEDLIKIIQDEKDNTNLTKTHWRGLAQITWVMTSSFKVKEWKLWWIRIEFSKNKWENEHERIIKRNKKSKIEDEVKPVDKREFDLEWEVDLNNLDKISEPIQEYINDIDFPVEVVLNCKKIKFFNSTFIWKIAEWHSVIDGYWWKMILKWINDEIFEILDLVWLTQILNIEV